MFSPVAQTSQTLLTGAKRGQNGAPFDLKWLAEHFDFDCADVKKAEFDSLIGVMFEVHFKPGKESITQQFYSNLTSKGCHPQYFKFNNSVCLNKHQKEKILSSGLSTSTQSSDQPLISQERITLLGAIAIRDQILSTPKLESISSAKFNSNLTISSSVIEKSTLELTLEKIIPKPFNLILTHNSVISNRLPSTYLVIVYNPSKLFAIQVLHPTFFL